VRLETDDSFLAKISQMIHAGPWGKSGSIIHVNVEHDDFKSDIKRRVSNATGIPVPELKLIMASPTQIAAGSKKCPGLAYGNCGVVDKVGLAVVQAESGENPFVPKLSPNRVDNKGNWTSVD
jgi:acetylglutamate kinase|tara:strand:+ start:4287 stop:4652 length:366 start_codon:yes stop_codon:yes gene_type:complete